MTSMVSSLKSPSDKPVGKKQVASTLKVGKKKFNTSKGNAAAKLLLGKYPVKKNKLSKVVSVYKSSNEYELKSDKTLSKLQKITGSFRRKSSYRVESRKTSLGHSTGMHEEVVPTDVMKLFDNAKPQKNGKIRVVSTNKNSPFSIHGPIDAHPEVFKWVVEAGDGFRSDTARTLLSVKGEAAGHSGSNLSTKNQQAAHDAIRETLITILEKEPSSQVTKRSISVAFASIAMISYAPGELIRSNLKNRSLKDKSAALDWELRRDAGKQKVDKLWDGLSLEEKKFVRGIAQQHLNRVATSGSTPAASARSLELDRARSPTRSLKTLDGVQGGGYVSGPLMAVGVAGPPKGIREIGMYASSDRRAALPG